MNKNTNQKDHYYISEVMDSSDGLWAIFIYRAVKQKHGIHYISFSLPVHKNAKEYPPDLDFSMRKNFPGTLKTFKTHMAISKKITKAQYTKHWSRAKRRLLNKIKTYSPLGPVDNLVFNR